jgi:GTP:adenosylcobinamide-phosphate guanylyltransferase
MPMSASPWTAIVLAGNRPGESGFADAHGVSTKALIPVAGEPMLARVVRTLLATPEIGQILILAQNADSLLEGALGWIKEDPRIRTAASGQGISTSIAAVAGTPAAPFPILVTTADHALLTPAMIEAFLAQAQEADAAFALVERRTIEAAVPETRRTWLKFSDGHYSGANLFALRTQASHKGLAIWSSVEKDRKKAVRLMLSFGPLLALRALTRTISLDAAIGRIGTRAGLRLKAVRLPFAEAAIDVDKEADLLLAERLLSRREADATLS